MTCKRGAIGKYDAKIIDLYQAAYFTLDPKHGKVYGCNGKEIGVVKRSSVGTTSYMKVCLPVRKGVGHARSHWCPVHRVMALCLLGMPPNGKDRVNHKDGDGLNNKLKNLEWSSAKENTQHAIHVTGTFSQNGSKNKKALLNEKQAKHILLSDKSEAELALKYSVGWKTIQTVRLGSRWRELFEEVSKAVKYTKAANARKQNAKRAVVMSDTEKRKIATSKESVEKLALKYNISCCTVSRIRCKSKPVVRKVQTRG